MKFIQFILILVFLLLIIGCVNENSNQEVESNITNIIFKNSANKFLNKENIKEYGAKGDGISDDTLAIQEAINQAEDFTTLYFPEGEYIISSSLYINRSNLFLQGNSAILTYKPRKNEYFKCYFPQNGTIRDKEILNPLIFISGSFSSKTYDINNTLSEGTNKIAINSNYKGLSNGNIVLLTQEDYGKSIKTKDGFIKYFRNQNIMSKISNISENALYINENINIPFYKANNSKLYKVNPVSNIIINDLAFRVDFANKFSNSGIVLNCVSDSILDNISLFSCHDSSISLISSCNISIFNNTISNMKTFDENTGIAIRIDHSHNGLIHNNFINDTQQGILLELGNSNFTISENKIIDSKHSAAIELSGGYNFFNTISNNEIYQSNTGILIGGAKVSHYNDGPNNQILNNLIDNCHTGIKLKNETKNIFIEENTFHSIKKSDLALINLDPINVID